MKSYNGSFHCGKVRIRVKAEIDRVVECNCSFCTKRGGLLYRITPENFEIISGEKSLGIYQFNTKVARHYFCQCCGIHVFSNPRVAPEMFTINVRCLDDFDLQNEVYKVVHFDGRNWEESVERLTSLFKRNGARRTENSNAE